MWCWWLVLWWVVVLEQASGSYDVIRWFKFILGVSFIFWNCEWILLIYMYGYYLIVFNTCKHYISWWWFLFLWWVVVLEQAGGLYGVISWFKFILGVFFSFSFLIFFYWIVNGYCWFISDGYYLIVFNTCKHYIWWYW